MKIVNNQAVIFKLVKKKTKTKPKGLKFIYTALQRKMAFKLPS